MTITEPNRWALMAPIDQNVNREELGYEILKEDTIKCANCKRELVEVLKVKEDKEINTAIRAVCPYCHDTSFWYKISGKIYIQATDDVSIDSNPVVKQNGILFTTIQLVKNKQ